MLFEIGSIIIATVLSLSGASVSNNPANFTPLASVSCTTYDPNSCLESDACDVFIASSGGESCALACDLRDVATCEIDSECQLQNGKCGYPSDDPIGC